MNVCYLKKPVLLYNKFNLADIQRTVYVQNSVYVRVIVVVFLIVFCFVTFCRLTEAKRFCIVNILCLKRKKQCLCAKVMIPNKEGTRNKVHTRHANSWKPC